MRKHILLAAAAITLAACSTEDKYIDDPVAAHISATIGDDAMSRATDNTWGNGDCIGISMSGRYTNLRYITETGNGEFAGTQMYFANKQDAVNITAYYPFSGSEDRTPEIIETSTTAERQTPAEHPSFDFLYAVKENVTGAAPNITLPFSHRMSKLTVVFKNGNAGTDISKITSCEINGLILKGTFNPLNGDCSADASTPAAPLTLTSMTGGKLHPLILFPQTVDKVTMKITDSEAQEYSCELKFDGNRLESGYNYLYTINVNKTGLNVEEFAIVKWIEHSLGTDAVSE